MQNKKLYIKEFPSRYIPVGIGEIFFAASDKGLTDLFVGESRESVLSLIKCKYQKSPIAHPSGSSEVLFSLVTENLKKYFKGAEFDFSFPLDLTGTEFQIEVWSAMVKIPYGKTVSYKQLAFAVNRPLASRALGSACGKNPIPIIIPCHRVISSDGSIGGFSLGVEKKKILSVIEGIESITYKD